MEVVDSVQSYERGNKYLLPLVVLLSGWDVSNRYRSLKISDVGRLGKVFVTISKNKIENDRGTFSLSGTYSLPSSM